MCTGEGATNNTCFLDRLLGQRKSTISRIKHGVRRLELTSTLGLIHSLPGDSPDEPFQRIGHFLTEVDPRHACEKGW